MSEPETPAEEPPRDAAEALARARASLDRIPDPETAREEVAATDPADAPLADPEAAPGPAYPKEPETAPATPRRSAADVARAIDEAPPELAVFAAAPAPMPAAPERLTPVRLGDTTSPVDLPEPAVPLPGALGWTTRVIAVATLFLALFNAQAIRGWAYQLPPSPTSASLAAAAEGWYAITAAAGLDRPYALLHAWYGDVKQARFADAAQPAEANAAQPR